MTQSEVTQSEVTQSFEKFDAAGFTGRVHKDYIAMFDPQRLAQLSSEVDQHKNDSLGWGRHRVVALNFYSPITKQTTEQTCVVKAFGKQGKGKDKIDYKRGSKAQRSFQAAARLYEHGVGTPMPIAYFDRWENQKLAESFYISEFIDQMISFRDLVRNIYRDRDSTAKLIPILEKVGLAIRQMHDAGFYHRDLGSQNIELSRDANGIVQDVYFLDLNRGRIREPLPDAYRASDFARLELSSGFLDMLLEIYWGGRPPKEFLQQVAKARDNFRLWQRSRTLRHPIQTLRKTKKPLGTGRTQGKDVWVWNEYSSQAEIAMNRTDRKRARSKRNNLKIAGSVIKSGLGIKSTYDALMPRAFQSEVVMTNRVGMSLDFARLDSDLQLERLQALGKVPVLVRVSHHEQADQIDKTINGIETLHQLGHDVTLAILQDRRAVLDPAAWQGFLTDILSRAGDKVVMVELCHAINRMKWGVHTLKELNLLLEPLAALKRQFPNVKFSGPACIDFEYHYVVAALNHAPQGVQYDALSHHLYVDRRGAPENQQGKYSLVEKAALLKSIAMDSKRCGDSVIVSEVNWPLQSTGCWSPVRRSYPMAREENISVEVSEHDYGCYMIRYYALALCSGFVDQVYWWQLVAHGYGLIDERAENGWRERIGYQMLVTFLQQLGQATFCKKLETPSGVYALQFKRAQDRVTLMWSNDEKFDGPLPVKYSSALNSVGEPLQKTPIIDGAPCYLISKL